MVQKDVLREHRACGGGGVGTAGVGEAPRLATLSKDLDKRYWFVICRKQ